MLILTRRIGENVRIGDQVTVTVRDVVGNQVRLGVAAPRSLSVHREEVYKRIAAEHGQEVMDVPRESSTKITTKKVRSSPR